MRSRIFALAGAVLLVAATPNAAFTQIGQGRQIIMDSLDLTDAQKAQLEQMQEQHRAEAAEARAEIIKARAEVQSMRAQPDTDLNALQRAMNRLSELENAHMIQAMKNREAYKDVLTEEQREQLGSARGAGAFFLLSTRFGYGRASFGRAGSGMRGRNPRSMRGFGRGIQPWGGRGIPPGAGAGFYRGGWGNPASLRMEGHWGNVDLRTNWMRARMQRPGRVTPPPPPID